MPNAYIITLKYQSFIGETDNALILKIQGRKISLPKRFARIREETKRINLPMWLAQNEDLLSRQGKHLKNST